MPNTRDYAVVVGVNHYKKLQLLEGPINDAISFKDWLVNPDGGDLPEGNCKLITSNGVDPFLPIQDTIDDALASIVEPRKPEGYRRLYFFFAGHGVGVKWDVNGLCMPKWSDVFRNAALSSKGYLDLIVESNLFEEVYFFLDCCRDRRINANPLHPSLGWARPEGGTCKSLVLYATDFENAAYEGSIGNGGNQYIRGYFSQALVEGLNGAAVNEKGNITVDQLINTVKKRTEELAKAKQTVTPQSYNMDADYVLFEKSSIPETTVTINFKEQGKVKLEDPSLTQVILEGMVQSGDAWNISLKKGLYPVTNSTTGKEKYIRINGDLKTLTYDF
jgi:hypothetical protein